MRELLGKLASRSLSVAGKWQNQQLRRLNIHEYQVSNPSPQFTVGIDVLSVIYFDFFFFLLFILLVGHVLAI